MKRRNTLDPTPVVIYDAERRARRSIALPLPLCLISEVVAEIPSARIVNIWHRVSPGSYALSASNLPTHRYQESEMVLNGDLRPKLKLSVFGNNSRRATYTERRLTPIAIKSGPSWKGSALVGVQSVWGFVLRLTGGRSEYLVELYSTTHPLADCYRALTVLLRRYVTAYEGAVSLAAHSDNRQGEKPLALTHSAALSEIQDRVSRTVRSRTLPREVSETHLFLLDPEDTFLYYASTDHLRAKTAKSIHLPPAYLRKDQQEYIRSRINSYDSDLGLNGALVSTFDRLIDQGVELGTNELSLIKLILRCLPQELDTGVAGDAASSQVLTVGGSSRGQEKRWDPKRLRDRFFVYKLLIEQVFGVARRGHLVAAPVFDGPQVAGTIFAVSSRLHPHINRAVLEAAHDAGEVLSAYRQATFLRAVMKALTADPGTDARLVIGENLPKILTPRLVFLVKHKQVGAEVSAAWWKAPTKLAVQPMDPEDLIALARTDLMRALALSAKETESFSIQGIAAKSLKDPWFLHMGELPRTCVIIRADRSNHFLVLIAEDVASVKRSRGNCNDRPVVTCPFDR